MILKSQACTCIRMVQRWITLTGVPANQTIILIMCGLNYVLLSLLMEQCMTTFVSECYPLFVNHLMCKCPSCYYQGPHHQTQVDFTSLTSTDEWKPTREYWWPHIIWYDLTFFATHVSRLTILYTYISNNNSVVFYWGLLKRSTCTVFAFISLRKFNVNTSNCN